MEQVIVRKITDLLKNAEIAKKVEACTGRVEVFEVLSPLLPEMTHDLFEDALDLIESKQVDLTDEDLEETAGGGFGIHCVDVIDIM